MLKKLVQGISKGSLEKRIFVLFFIITFVMVAIIILVEWQMVTFAIRQNEDKELNNVLNNYNKRHFNLIQDELNLLGKIADDPRILEFLKNPEDPGLQAYIQLKYNLPLELDLTILAKNREVSYGSNWGLIEANKADIFQQSLINQPGIFFSNYGQKLYKLTFVPVFIQTPIYDLEGILLFTERADKHLTLTANNIGFQLESMDSFKNGIINTEVLKPHSDQFISSVNKMIEERLNSAIIRINSDLAVVVRLNYDLKNIASAILVYPYYRNINQFAEQSIILFFLILIFVTLIMIILLGNWFSKSILDPVKKISTRMQDIGTNPDQLDTLPINYTGVLGEMATTFNTMNISLNNYSNNLKEYKAITESLSSGIFWLDDKFNILVCNPELHKIFRVKPNTLPGLGLNSFLNLSEEHKNTALAETLTLTNYEVSISGYKRYLLINIRPVMINERLKLVGNVTDISKGVKEKQAREALEMELIKSNKLAEIGRRIEGIVHNINSPLNSILGYSQLIRKEEGYPKDVDKILESGKNIAHYVKGLLNKIKQGNISMMRPISINSMVQSELDLCQHNLFFKHYVILTTEFANDIGQVKAVYGDISLCVANLINNSIEAMQEAETKDLNVRTYMSEGMVAIEIKDTGEGVSQENIKKIFEPYFSTKSHKEGGGFGLGLAITKNIIDKYQGELRVISEVNSGATFTIFLPVD